MKALLIGLMTLGLLTTSILANENQTCTQLGDLTGSYTTIFDSNTTVSEADPVDTILARQKKKMTYLVTDISDDGTGTYTIKLKNSIKGCKIVGENIFVERMEDGNILFLSPELMYILIKR